MANNLSYKEHLNQLDTIFDKIHNEIENLEKKPETFKFQKLPLARVKKIMKADEDVKMISAEAPVLFAKACEMFIIELTHRSYYHTIENKRKTLQRSDIAQTIASTDIYDFLQDIIPKEELKEAQESNKKAQEEINLKAANVMENANNQPDIYAGPASIDNGPRANIGEISYLQPSRVKAEVIEKDDENMEGFGGPSGSNITNLFTEMDPSNINQNDLKEKSVKK
eukprot:CAMPEP_0168338864 /NCGR_PEP_ID=MMETSP0213-20121227/13114_1 /TAXON_ID=151035 /ORGANISM="Euplotes harpa, Strain FSP1.4" /LENGTH=224 /DNA_ID=CAMNT_0008344775 /DNA_START=47 /DNA_END=721 /DNA_ORIENTATION=+